LTASFSIGGWRKRGVADGGMGSLRWVSFNIGDPGISRLYSRTTRRVLEGELSKKFFLTKVAA
jgi:hypothetical protein